MSTAAADNPNKRARTPTPEQRRAADPTHSVWVAASAGSGKTQVLTDRLLRLLLSGVDPQQILCLTYTKAAAAEMAARLFAELSGWISLSDGRLADALTRLGVDGTSQHLRTRARRLFATAMETPGGLKIQTIHSFAERLLQLFPVEAGLAPGFRVLDDLQSGELRRNALHLALMEPDLAPSWAMLASFGMRRMDSLQQLAQDILRHGEQLLLAKATAEGSSSIEWQLRQALGLDDPRSTSELEAAITSIDHTAYRDWSQRLKDSPEQGPKDTDYLYLRRISDATDPLRLQAIEEYFLTSDGKFGKKFARKSHLESAGIAEAFEGETKRLNVLFETLWLRRCLDATLAVLDVMARVRTHMEAFKRARGLYDFDDLIYRAAQLLTTVEQAQWVQYKLDKALTHALVDEAQDTSPVQWQIVLALVREFFAGHGQRDNAGVRTVFVVGDRKQSIFSFQGADVAAFDESRDLLAQWAGKALQPVRLNISYRSLKHVLASVDMAFAAGRRPREGYGIAALEEREHQHHREEGPGIVELWDLETRSTQDEIDYWKSPVDATSEDHPRRKLARRIAATLKRWIGKRLLTGSQRTVLAGDILILVQKRGAFFALLIAELRRLGIPVAGADRLQLANHIIVQDLLALAQALLLPGDDFSLACVLKSPLMPEPLDDDGLFALAHERKGETLRQRFMAASGQARNVSAFSHYARLLQQEGPFGFFAHVAQANMKAIITRLGSEAEDAVHAFLDLALAYEQEEGRSVAGFCAAMAGSDFVIKREFEEQSGQVRIMTVHGAKGLEAPIVMLADAADGRMARNDSNIVLAATGQVAQGWPVYVPESAKHARVIEDWKSAAKQRAFEESMRLLYVAMTRARDELYVCGSFARQRNAKAPSKDCWYSLLDSAFTQQGTEFRELELPDGHKVWRLGSDDVYETRDDTGEMPEKLPDLPAWLSAPIATPATKGKWRVERQGQTIDLASAAHGIAVHSLLEAMPQWPAPERRAKAEARAKRNGLPLVLVERLLSLIDRPDTAFFFADGSQAEVAVGGRLPSGESVTARIDRLAWHEGAICILDYKSARRPDMPLEADHPYVSQLGRYAWLLRQAYPETPVKTALLWTQSGEIEWISDAFLARNHGIVVNPLA